MKLSLVTGAWQRHTLFEFFCRYYKDLQKKIDFELIVACSEPETIAIAKKYGHSIAKIANQPLYRKFNAASEMAKGSDYCIMIGSDDFLTAETLKHYIELFKEGYDYIFTLDWYFYDTKTKKGLYWKGYSEPYRYGKGCGAGRALSKNLMDKMKWNPWISGFDNLLDTGMEKQLDRIPHTEYGFRLRDEGLFALDIKSDVNMTKFERWDNSIEFDGKEMIKTYLPKYADEIFKLK